MKLLILIIALIPALPIRGAVDCQTVGVNIEQYIQKLNLAKEDSPDSSKYMRYTEQFIRLSNTLDLSDCDVFNRDSMKIELTLWFAEYCAKQQGDLEQYAIYLESVKNLSNEVIDSLKQDEKVENSDRIRQMNFNLEDVDSRRHDLDLNYKSLKIIIADQEPFMEMTSVESEASGELRPVMIHFRPPRDVYQDDLKTRRLLYLSSNFKMILTSYSAAEGFYFEIPFVPLSTNLRPMPEDTYAITFDNRARYRLQTFCSEEQDSLEIATLSTWVYKSLVPENFVKIEIPGNLQYTIFDSRLNQEIPKSNFVIVPDKNSETIYLPNDARYTIGLASLQRNWITRFRYLSVIIILGSILYVLL